jgi:UDP-N-acetylmuramoyl-L-alanyl-D-glutamate--2,6-diaminopimelate ligase
VRQETLFSCAVSLRRLLPQASFVGCTNLCITDAAERADKIRNGALFAVIRGTKLDARQFIGEAVARGAAGLLVDAPLPDSPLPQCVVTDVRSAFSRVCESLSGDPSRRLDISAITGTNGKSTTAWLIRSLLEKSGRRCGLLGTVEYSDGLTTSPSTLTTPDSRSLAQWLGGMVHAGSTHAAIELSSHALHQGRAAGIELEAAIVTNVTQDHFDYHQTFEAYLAAKARIFEMVRPGGLVALNLDDRGAWSLRDQAGESVSSVSFGLNPAADITAQVRDESLFGTRFRLGIHGRTLDCATRLIGRHNVSNILAGVAAATHLGLTPEEIVTGIESFRSVPGRLEAIDCGQPFNVFVDYAHTDDALRRCLASLKSLTSGRVICVFGAGGDRDRVKRPKLGQAAVLADIAIVTSDNPRSEDPVDIIDQILAGMQAANTPPRVECDRRLAIQLALKLARAGDCILIAGKGHENQQIIGNDRFPFDDRQVVREILRERWQPLAQPPARVSD